MTAVDIVRGGLLLVALLALIKVAVPPLAFHMGLVRLRIRSDDDPRRAEPPPGDADYRRRFQQFTELGFHPVGTTEETCWFGTPYDWHKRWHLTWMAAPDGRTLASFHRLTDDEPIRFGAVTILEGGGMVRTTCPGTKTEMPLPEGYHRVELRGVDPADLLAHHRQAVTAFSQKQGRAVVSATLREAASVEQKLDAQVVARIDHSVSNRNIQVSFGVPALVALGVQALATHGEVGATHLAFAICVGAATCEWMVRSLVRPYFRTAVLASHEGSRGPDPISSADAPPDDRNAN